MLPSLKEYLEESAARNISLLSFMRQFPDINEKDHIIRIWNGALSYLRQHSSLEKRQLYMNLRKYTHAELEKIVDKELREREHDNTLLANASRQELAASHMHTKQVEERFSTERKEQKVSVQQKGQSVHLIPSRPLTNAGRLSEENRKDDDIESTCSSIHEQSSPSISAHRRSSSEKRYRETQDRVNSEEHYENEEEYEPIYEQSSSSSSSTQVNKQSKSSKRQKIVQIFKLKPESITSTTYFKNEEDVGSKFFSLQLDGVDLVNDAAVMATSRNLHCFLSINSIWDTAYPIGLKKDTVEGIRDSLVQVPFKFSQEDHLLILGLEQDLKSNLRKTHIGRNNHQQIAVHIFSSLMYSLPATHFSYKQDVEDTFVHKTLDALFSSVFSMFDLEWANKHAEGSRERRKDGLRPDLQLSICGRTVLFLEVKPPGPNQQESDCLSDKWKLLNLAKDEIDRNMRLNFHLPFVVTVQVFGHRMEINTVTFRSGIYHAHEQFVTYLPRAKDDPGSIRFTLEALFSIESWINNIEFPPEHKQPSMLPHPSEFGNIKKTLLTPSKRKMF